MYDKMLGSLGDTECVVARGQCHQETGRIDADLRGEPDQTTRPFTASRGGHDKHRVIEDPGYRIEDRFTAGIQENHPVDCRPAGDCGNAPPKQMRPN